jgi:large subunit ribosomal protein L17
MHRHQNTGRKLRREAGPRKALLRNLVSQVILNEKIKTTLEKAKEVRPILEKLITKAKKGTLADRRNAGKFMTNNDKALEKLFAELGPLYAERKGGYTRIIKIPNRFGDNAKMAQIELLDTEKLTKKEMEKPKKEKKVKKEEGKGPKSVKITEKTVKKGVKKPTLKKEKK